MLNSTENYFSISIPVLPVITFFFHVFPRISSIIEALRKRYFFLDAFCYSCVFYRNQMKQKRSVVPSLTCAHSKWTKNVHPQCFARAASNFMNHEYTSLILQESRGPLAKWRLLSASYQPNIHCVSLFTHDQLCCSDGWVRTTGKARSKSSVNYR